MQELEILYTDEYIVVINKPNGLLVHRSKYADEAKVFAVQELRNQIGKHVWPCHRLDRKTSGVLVFALSPEINSIVQQQFENNLVSKTYWAIVRGYTDDEGIIDYPLVNDKGKEQNAVTKYKTLQRVEIPVPLGRFDTSRYSLVEVYPQNGRLHQIRKHFAHIFHPIIGDRPHGCNKQNRLFKNKWGITSMILHSKKLKIEHPVSLELIEIEASLQPDFKEVMGILDINLY